MRALLLACRVAAAPALGAPPQAPSAQAQSLQFPAAVEQVLVDAVVLDRDGTPVGG
jgi:hypothetical protein